MLDEVRGWLQEAQAVTVLAGAGISTESGIPDFRGPQGLWTRNPAAQTMFAFDSYVADAAVRRDAWQARLDHPAWHAEPNDGHRALVDLERAGRLHTLVTQNIDGLHQRAGTSPARLVEIHGTLSDAICLSCADRTPMSQALDRVRAGELDPDCRRCGGILKSATISFGQSLVAADLARAERAAASCDLFLAVGTSLTVFPAAGLVDTTLDSGARLVIVNAQPTPYDDAAAAVLRDPIGEVLPALVAPLAA